MKSEHFLKKKFEKKVFYKSKFSLVLDPMTAPYNRPGVLVHLFIGLVDTKYTKLGKIGEKLLLILGLAHINFPL